MKSDSDNEDAEKRNVKTTAASFHTEAMSHWKCNTVYKPVYRNRDPSSSERSLGSSSTDFISHVLRTNI